MLRASTKINVDLAERRHKTLLGSPTANVLLGSGAAILDRSRPCKALCRRASLGRCLMGSVRIYFLNSLYEKLHRAIESLITGKIEMREKIISPLRCTQSVF
jgi:hypothetical protein